jgi:peptidase E
MERIMKTLLFSNGSFNWSVNFVEKGRDLVQIQVDSSKKVHYIPLLLNEKDMMECIEKINKIQWKSDMTIKEIHMIIAGAASFSMKKPF